VNSCVRPIRLKPNALCKILSYTAHTGAQVTQTTCLNLPSTINKAGRSSRILSIKTSGSSRVHLLVQRDASLANGISSYICLRLCLTVRLFWCGWQQRRGSVMIFSQEREIRNHLRDNLVVKASIGPLLVV
jgi:hypothetical protein